MRSTWPNVKLAEVLTPAERGEHPVPGRSYRQIGIKLWGDGAYERELIDGGATKYSRLFRAEAGDVIVNRIWARNGSVAVVPITLAGCFGSGEFPMFDPKRNRLEPQWIHWLTKTPGFWSECDDKSRGTSGKNRIRPERFLEIEIPLPPLPEQRRIVARIEELAAEIEEAKALRKQVESDQEDMLNAVFSTLAEGSPRQRLGEIAPIVRHAVAIDASADYPELGIRSFGKGTFHKPATNGAALGSKRLFGIHAGDLIFNNVFAWEGAVAVAGPEDAGRFGSHRFVACVPKPGVCTSHFLCFYFLTKEGLSLLGEASPGGAGRNRTLGLEALSRICVPVPEYRRQTWFDELQSHVDKLKRLQSETAAELDSLLPSILDKAFKGEL